MDKKYIENEFNSFMEFPADDKNVVTSASAKLFAEHIAYPLECEVSTLRENNRTLLDQRFDLMEEISKQSVALNLAREAIQVGMKWVPDDFIAADMGTAIAAIDALKGE